MNNRQEQQILDSWNENARPWARLIQRQAIDSRRVTDPAIVEAILAHQPARVLDVGCGEGWLCRTLAERGLSPIGLDATDALIRLAREQHPGGQYHCLAYHELTRQPPFSDVDLVVCNFSLFGDDNSLGALFASLHTLLRPGGTLLVQTLHPLTSCHGNYRDGWRESSWDGFDGDFRSAPPWYFRTLAGWTRLFRQQGFALYLDEPAHPDTGQPLSVIFHATVQGASE